MTYEIDINTIMEVDASADYSHHAGQYAFVDFMYTHGKDQMRMLFKDGSTEWIKIDDLNFPLWDLWVITEIDGDIFYDAIHSNTVSALDDAMQRKGNGRYELRHFVNGHWEDISHIIIDRKVYKVVPEGDYTPPERF